MIWLVEEPAWYFINLHFHHAFNSARHVLNCEALNPQCDQQVLFSVGGGIGTRGGKRISALRIVHAWTVNVNAFCFVSWFENAPHLQHHAKLLQKELNSQGEQVSYFSCLHVLYSLHDLKLQASGLGQDVMKSNWPCLVQIPRFCALTLKHQRQS